VRLVSVPAAEIASRLGFIGAANVVALAAYIGLTGVIRADTLRQSCRSRSRSSSSRR